MEISELSMPESALCPVSKLKVSLSDFSTLKKVYRVLRKSDFPQLKYLFWNLVSVKQQGSSLSQVLPDHEKQQPSTPHSKN